MNRRLSVVMPVYNGERFLGQAIESVQGQTFSDFELHIVDDASTDGTLDVIQKYADKDDRIIVHRQPANSGVTAALNVGCRSVTSELIARMDADDISLPHRFARQVAFLDENPDVGLIGSYVQVIDEDGKLGAVWPCPNHPGLTAWSMLFYCALAHPSIMMRRSVLERVGFYPVGYAAEDYALFVRLLHITRLTNIGEVLLHYRVWKENLTTVRRTRLESDSARILREDVGESAGIELSDADIELMRDFARHVYPSTPAQIARLSQLMSGLLERQAGLPPLTAEDVREMYKDAGLRMLILSAVALKRAQAVAAARLAGRAMRISPASVSTFALKAIRRASQRAAGVFRTTPTQTN